MDETILFPSPNWFLATNLAVSRDGWLVYGGPSKSLCVLEPLGSDLNLVVTGNQGYRAHVVNRAHAEKIVSVDISPEWPEKRSFLSGSADGSVKQWTLENIENRLKLKTTHSHEIHHNEKEEVVGVGYSNEVYAITVGCFGNIVKWNLNSNVVKTYSTFLKNFKPVSMSCSHHIPMNVAVGTKQGVIFVLDLNGSGKIVYKVRGQDDEVMNISWCPLYDIAVKKSLKESEKRSFLADRLEAIRNEPEQENVLEASGIIKKLPDDSFDEPVVPEDDMFDIYKDHEANEFGHKKYQPHDVLVKIKDETSKDTDFLVECKRLKEDILKQKNQTEPSIESLVDALDKTHVDSDVQSTSAASNEQCKNEPEKTKEPETESSDHTHKHLLATISKHGGVRIWSKSGKLVGSCAVPSSGKNPRSKVSSWPTLLWYKPDVLLIADGKSQLLACNPLKIDCKNKLEWRVIHSYHKRGLYCIASSAPRVQTDAHSSEHWPVWTVSQERNMIRYCMETKQMTSYGTCGGFVYAVQPCPYDAGKIAVSVGDGAVRVWESSTSPDDETKLTSGHVDTYWQNVQGKVLIVAWHPTRENLLAFSTAESRVGLIDTSGKTEKPARVLISALNGGVYSLCWGEGFDMYACGGGDLVKYRTDKPDEAPSPIPVELEGSRWQVSAVQWDVRGLACGGLAGAVAVLTTEGTYNVTALAYVFTKMIHTIEWHPLQTSSSSEESQYKNLIAVCSLDKEHTVVILEYGDKEDGSKQLVTWKTLSGHKAPVLQISWNPHRDAQLLSTSQDATVRIWEAVSGTCVSIFGGHSQASLGAAWSSRPQLADYVMSGGADCCLRLWNIHEHRAEDYVETKHETVSKKKKIKEKKEIKKAEDETTEVDEQVAASLESKRKAPKRFLLPLTSKQISPCKIQGLRKLFQKYLEKDDSANGVKKDACGDKEVDLDYIKMFGSINEVNELLDKEMERHLEAGNSENRIMLSIFRGHIDSMIQYANQNDLLCPYLVSIAPCVSFKYWKDVTQMYVAQIDRLVAKGEEEKLYDNRAYGGPVLRKVAALLSIHDVKGAVATLTEANLYKEAYILCRIRYIDSIAEETLRQWAHSCLRSGLLTMSALCHIALCELSEAATILAKLNDQESLSLAADLAKVTGQTTFADHMEKKAQSKIQVTDNNTAKVLEQLPSRMELLIKDSKTENGNVSENVPLNCDSVANE